MSEKIKGLMFSAKLTKPELQELRNKVRLYQEGKYVFLGRGNCNGFEREQPPYLDIDVARDGYPDLIPFFEALALLHSKPEALTENHLASLDINNASVDEALAKLFQDSRGEQITERLLEAGLLVEWPENIGAQFKTTSKSGHTVLLLSLLYKLSATPLAELKQMLDDDGLPELSRSSKNRSVFQERVRDYFPSYEHIQPSNPEAEADKERRRKEKEERVHNLVTRCGGEILSTAFQEFLREQYLEHLPKLKEERQLEHGIRRDFEMDR